MMGGCSSSTRTCTQIPAFRRTSPEESWTGYVPFLARCRSTIPGDTHTQQCCTHLDNCYQVPDVWIRGRLCKTNIHSNTAFRGFGGPQAMFIAEQMMHAVAEGLNIDVDELRLRNLYRIGDRTPFHQLIDDDWHVPTMMRQLKQSSDYERRKAAVAAYNAEHRWRKRGISLVPCKFGLSFATAIHLNQAGASVKIYADGSVLLHHGGTEMGIFTLPRSCHKR